MSTSSIIVCAGTLDTVFQSFLNLELSQFSKANWANNKVISPRCQGLYLTLGCLELVVTRWKPFDVIISFLIYIFKWIKQKCILRNYVLETNKKVPDKWFNHPGLRVCILVFLRNNSAIMYHDQCVITLQGQDDYILELFKSTMWIQEVFDSLSLWDKGNEPLGKGLCSPGAFLVYLVFGIYKSQVLGLSFRSSSEIH